MCLGVPGQIVQLDRNDLGLTMGQVKFGGITKEVCLAYTPDVRPGDWVLVHVGFSISRLDEESAREIFRTLEEMGDLADLGPPSG